MNAATNLLFEWQAQGNFGIEDNGIEGAIDEGVSSHESGNDDNDLMIFEGVKLVQERNKKYEKINDQDYKDIIKIVSK